MWPTVWVSDQRWNSKSESPVEFLLWKISTTASLQTWQQTVCRLSYVVSQGGFSLCFRFVMLFFLNCLKTFDFENITVFFSSSSLLQFCLVLILTNSVGRDRIITILWWSAGQNVDPDTQPEASDEIPCFSVMSGNSKKTKNQNNNRVTTGSDVEP